MVLQAANPVAAKTARTSRESLQNLTVVDVEMCHFESTSGELIRFSYVFNMLLMTGQTGLPT